MTRRIFIASLCLIASMPLITGCSGQNGEVSGPKPQALADKQSSQAPESEQTVPPDQFRLTVEETKEVGQSSIIKRLVIEVGSPEGKRIGIGFGDRRNLDADAPQEPATLEVSGRLEPSETAEIQDLRVKWSLDRAGGSWGSDGVIGQTEMGKNISDVFQFQITSGLYSVNQPVVLATMSVDPQFPSLILHITDQTDEPKKEQAE